MRATWRRFWRGLKKERSFASAVPVGLFSAEGEIFLKAGGLMVGADLCPPDSESLSRAELEAMCERFEQALSHLGSGDVLHIEHCRVPAPGYPEHEFATRAAALADAERRAAFGNERYWQSISRAYLSRCLARESTARLSSLLFSAQGGANLEAWNYEIERFREDARGFIDALTSLGARRLSSAEMFLDQHRYYTGLEHPMPPPVGPVHLDEVLADQTFFGGLYPRIGDLHFRPITISYYPAHTFPELLWFVLSEPGRLRFSVRWIAQDAADAQHHGEQVRGQWARRRRGLVQMVLAALNMPQTRVNQFAEEMVADADEVIAKTAAGMPFGFLTLTVLVIDEDPTRATARARELVRRLRNSGVSARLEDVNAVEKIKGSWPGEGWSDVTRPLVSGVNFAHLAVVSQPWPGTPTVDSPYFAPNTPAPLVCCSPGRAPFYLPPSSGGGVLHMLILGPTGAGKSVLLAVMAMAWTGLKGARVRWIDLDYSSFVAAHVLKADYRELGHDGSPALCPLAHAGTPEEDEFLLAYFTRLFARWQKALAADEQRELAHSIELAAGEDLRRLRYLAGLIQVRELRRILSEYTETGPWGHLFDGKPGSAQDAQVRVYETRGLVALGERAAAPALEWLLHEIERECDGSPTLIFIDEAWRLLSDPVSADWFYSGLRTLRKRNAGIVLATQSITEIAASPYCNLLLESCPAKIFLPNPEARGEQVRQAYLKLGLTARQAEIIASATARSQYYYTSPLGSRLFNLDLGPVARALCGSTGHTDLRRARELLAEGGDFLEAWLSERGVSELAGRLVPRPPRSCAETKAVSHANGLDRPAAALGAEQEQPI